MPISLLCCNLFILNWRTLKSFWRYKRQEALLKVELSIHLWSTDGFARANWEMDDPGCLISKQGLCLWGLIDI